MIDTFYLVRGYETTQPEKEDEWKFFNSFDALNFYNNSLDESKSKEVIKTTITTETICSENIIPSEKQIRLLLISKNIKQKDLIKALHSNKSDISNAIAGRNRPILQKEILNYLKSI